MIFAALALFVSATQIFTPGNFRVFNHEKRVSLEPDRMFRGERCIYVTGTETGTVDTAWRMVSERVGLPVGKRGFRISFDAYAERRIYGTSQAGEGFNNSILWYRADGSALSADSLGFSVPRGDFSRIVLEGPVPQEAAFAVVQIGFDMPNLTSHDIVAYRDFVFETLGGDVPDRICVHHRVKPLPKLPVEHREYKTDRVPCTPKVTLRDDGMTIVDGKPFFPIGMYSVVKREWNGFDFDIAFDELKKAGFNFAHTYGNPWDPEFLAAARKHGLKLWVGAQWPDKHVLKDGRFNPDILAWYTGDDTCEHETPEESLAYHQALKAVDPTRLTCQADNVDACLDSSRYTDFVNCTDVFMPELYGIRRGAGDASDTNCVAWVIKEMKGVMRDIRSCAGGRPKGVWPILQCFMGWSDWDHYPSRQQIFATSFASLVHGANGITWYTYSGYFDRRKMRRNEGMTSSPERFRDMADLATWIKELSHALVERSGVQPPPAEVLAGPRCDAYGNPAISLLFKRVGTESYLITVNSTYENVRARIRMKDVPRVAAVMREHRDVDVPDGVLEDEFGPFAVHVYRFNVTADK